MADKIKIGLRPYEGEYDLDLDEQPFNFRELRWIKQISGRVADELTLSDTDVLLAIAVIALVRNGKVDPAAALSTAADLEDQPFAEGTIQFIGGAVPPAEPATPASANEQPEDSGVSSEPKSESQDSHPFHTGDRGSVKSAGSHQLTSSI